MAMKISRSKRTKDLTGQKFGKLVVVSFWGYKKIMNRNNAVWNCKCDCGKLTKTYAYRLKNGATKSCGCYQRESVAARSRIEYGLSAAHTLYTIYKDSAGKRKRTFEITFDQAMELFQKSCYYCNKLPSQIFHKKQCPNGDFVYNGIDRIDNTLGYVLDNCVSCCGQCNYMKHSQVQKDFLEQIERIHENMKTKRRTNILPSQHLDKQVKSCKHVL